MKKNKKWVSVVSIIIAIVFMLGIIAPIFSMYK